MNRLEALIEGSKARAHAQAFIAKLTGGAEVAGASSNLSQMGLTITDAITDVPLLDRPDQFERVNPENLIPFPPNFEMVACKPLLFDIARKEINFPDISKRTATRKGISGRLGAWFSRS